MGWAWALAWAWRGVGLGVGVGRAGVKLGVAGTSNVGRGVGSGAGDGSRPGLLTPNTPKNTKTADCADHDAQEQLGGEERQAASIGAVRRFEVGAHRASVMTIRHARPLTDRR